jgi:hypothetical protein
VSREIAWPVIARQDETPQRIVPKATPFQRRFLTRYLKINLRHGFRAGVQDFRHHLACFLPKHGHVHLNRMDQQNGEQPTSKRCERVKLSPECREQIKTAYASGIGLREIARNMGIPEGTVLARAQREGWTREIQNAKALAKREHSAPAVTATEAVAVTMQQRGERHLNRMAGVSERAVDHIETMDGPEILDTVDRIEKLDKVARRTFGISDVKEDSTQWVVNIAILNV